MSSWQLAQAVAAIGPEILVERTVCALWQSEHKGASLLPSLIIAAWTLSSYWVKFLAWQERQDSRMLRAKSRLLLMGVMVLPWVLASMSSWQSSQLVSLCIESTKALVEMVKERVSPLSS